MILFKSNITSKFSTLSIRNLSFRKVKNWYANLSPRRNTDPPYSHITQIGDPILRRKAEPVHNDLIKSKEIKFLIEKLKILLRKYDCAGLSAPQIGIPLQLFVMEFGEKRIKEFTPEVYRARKMCTVPFSVFINPEMKVINYNKISFPEACESVKGFSADVQRYSEIEIKAFNEYGENTLIKADGWTARIMQHEMDHLEGRIYTDLMDRKTLTCTCWEAVNKNCGKIELPYYAD